jgi:1-acyl-sn-glycerol-3-phosphate acyltransferase
MLIYIFVLAYLIGSIYAVRYLNWLFAKGLAMSRIEHGREKYFPFARFDLPKWNKLEMYLVGIFLLPAKLTVAMLSVVACGICNKIALAGADPTKELSSVRRALIKNINIIFPRIILFCAGFLWINRIRVKISDYDSNYQKPTTTKNTKAPIILANHVSWADILTHMSLSGGPSFLAKQEITGWPFVGVSCKAMQGLFVARENKDARDQVMDLIRKRVTEIEEGKDFPQMVIFPEGTTTNGTSLISFKKGAFAPLAPLDIKCLKYTGKFSPAMDIIGTSISFLVSFCQLYNGLTVYEFETFYPEYLNLKSEDDWKVYADTVRNIMSKTLNCKVSELGFRDIQAYQSELKEILKGSKPTVAKVIDDAVKKVE